MAIFGATSRSLPSEQSMQGQVVAISQQLRWFPLLPADCASQKAADAVRAEVRSCIDALVDAVEQRSQAGQAATQDAPPITRLETMPEAAALDALDDDEAALHLDTW